MRPQEKMASQTLEEVFGEKSAELAFQTVVENIDDGLCNIVSMPQNY